MTQMAPAFLGLAGALYVHGTVHCNIKFDKFEDTLLVSVNGSFDRFVRPSFLSLFIIPSLYRYFVKITPILLFCYFYEVVIHLNSLSCRAN